MKALPAFRALAQNLALLALSALLCLAAGEWVVRRYLPQAGLVYRLQPRYHYTLAPGTRKLFRHSEENGGGRVLFVVNSSGFRGDELRPNRGSRVVVYGDSFIEGEFSPLEETFAKRLEVRLGRALGRDVEVVNAGVSGYGPDQSLRRFEDEVEWLRPAAVVLATFTENDFGDVLRNQLYRLEDGRLVDGGGFLLPALRQEFLDAEAQTPWHLLRGIRRLAHWRRPVAAARLLPGRLSLYVARSVEMSRQEYDRIVIGGDRGVESVFRDNYDADVALLPGSPAAAYKRALLEGVLGRFRDRAAAAGVPVLLLVIPSPIDVCDAYDVKVDTTAYPEYVPSRLSGEIAAAAWRQGLPVVDLFDPFRAAGADRLFYRHGNDHWNAAGQDLAAELVAQRIVKEGWMAARDEGASAPGAAAAPGTKGQVRVAPSPTSPARSSR